MAHTSSVLASPPSTTFARKDVGRGPHCRWRRVNRRAGPARYAENHSTDCQEIGRQSSDTITALGRFTGRSQHPSQHQRRTDGAYWDFFKSQPGFHSGCGANRDSGRHFHVAVPSSEDARVLLGSDPADCHHSIDHPSARPELAALCGNRLGRGPRRSRGYVLPAQPRSLCRGNFLMRSAFMVIADRWRLSICWDHTEHRFADPTYQPALDRRLAPLPGGIVGYCSGAGGNNIVAVGKENWLNVWARDYHLNLPRITVHGYSGFHSGISRSRRGIPHFGGVFKRLLAG